MLPAGIYIDANRPFASRLVWWNAVLVGFAVIISD
jgi:hypothetical protein